MEELVNAFFIAQDERVVLGVLGHGEMGPLVLMGAHVPAPVRDVGQQRFARGMALVLKENVFGVQLADEQGRWRVVVTVAPVLDISAMGAHARSVGAGGFLGVLVLQMMYNVKTRTLSLVITSAVCFRWSLTRIYPPCFNVVQASLFSRPSNSPNTQPNIRLCTH